MSKERQVEITTDQVKALREKTGAGIMDCKRALQEAGGDLRKAEDVLNAHGLLRAEKKAGREASMGLVESYIHGGGKIGALVELNCETDFVARTEEFRKLAHDLAMQVAATNPRYLSADEVPAGEDPKDVALLSQPFIKDAGKSVQQLVTETVAKVGENVQVRRFTRFGLGELSGGEEPAAE